MWTSEDWNHIPERSLGDFAGSKMLPHVLIYPWGRWERSQALEKGSRWEVDLGWMERFLWGEWHCTIHFIYSLNHYYGNEILILITAQRLCSLRRLSSGIFCPGTHPSLSWGQICFVQEKSGHLAWLGGRIHNEDT